MGLMLGIEESYEIQVLMLGIEESYEFQVLKSVWITTLVFW